MSLMMMLLAQMIALATDFVTTASALASLGSLSPHARRALRRRMKSLQDWSFSVPNIAQTRATARMEDAFANPGSHNQTAQDLLVTKRLPMFLNQSNNRLRL